MLWQEIPRGLFDALRTNRLRFALTLLGVVIGTGSLVLLAGLLAGGKEALLGASQSAEESDLIEVRAGSAPEKQRLRTTRPLSQPDVDALDDTPLLDGAKVVAQRQAVEQVVWRKNRKMVTLVGSGPEALQLYRLRLARGRVLSASDLEDRRRVALVGDAVWRELFDSAEDLAGLEINARGERFLVIGTLAAKPSMGGDGPWQWDNRVLIPDTTFAATLAGPQRRNVDRMFVRLAEARDLAARLDGVRGVVRATLLRRHHGVENFRVRGNDNEAQEDMILTIISVLVLATAVVSLVVGGINVMNIMLVTVNERTREIGLRRALGATRSNILMQFLAESTVTAGVGGIVGVGGGIALTWAASLALRKAMGAWTFQIVPWAPPLGIGAALLVGITFGMYPAWRAARLDPVEALRSD